MQPDDDGCSADLYLNLRRASLLRRADHARYVGLGYYGGAVAHLIVGELGITEVAASFLRRSPHSPIETTLALAGPILGKWAAKDGVPNKPGFLPCAPATQVVPRHGGYEFA